MRKINLLALAIIATSFIYAQNPIKWSFTSKRTGDKVYEIHLTATVNDPWHIYSQTTPEGGPLPTKIKFNKNPLVSFEGEVKESGKLINKYEEVFDVDVRYFDGNVTFTQKLKLKANAKTTIGGVIEFMACNEEQCLPPTEVKFAILLQ